MGAKTWMLVASAAPPSSLLRAQPVLNRAAAAALAAQWFPERLEPLPDGTLAVTCPPDDEIAVGAFPGLVVVAAKEFGGDYPSRLPPRFLDGAGGRTVYLHAMHSVVDWFAFAVWRDGKLERALSVAPDSGILEDFGQRLAFEEPYWAGGHPVDGEYPLQFHPLDLGEAALLEFFGYQLEGAASSFDPESITLLRFKRPKPWWKLW